jgi:hypothetical protein
MAATVPTALAPMAGLGGVADSTVLTTEAFQPVGNGGSGGAITMTAGNVTTVVTRGGAGGGAVSIVLKGALVINGTISVDGESIDGAASVGAGAGGSIYVRARQVEGVGVLSAVGGKGKDNGGAGAGGRVAIAHQLGVDKSLVIEAVGGVPMRSKAGSAGTIVLITEGLDSAEVVVRRQAHLIVEGSEQMTPALIKPTRLPRVPESALPSLRRMEPYWTNVTLINAFVTFPLLNTRTFTMISSLIQQDDVFVTSSDLISIDSKSRIDASETSVAQTMPAVAGSGGAFGGHGGANLPNATAYNRGAPGNPLQPAAGTAGTPIGVNVTITKGLGGGRIRLIADKGDKATSVVTIDGVVQANGGSAVASPELTTGGGSGGGITIQGRTIGGSGTVSANGGGAAQGTANGGPGGGGRISLEFETLNDTLKIQVLPGSSLMDATAGTMFAGVGSVARRSFDKSINVIVLDGGAGTPSTRSAGSDWPATGATTAINVELRGNALVVGPASIELAGNITMIGALIRARNITLKAQSVSLSGGARITASGMGPGATNAAADTMLGPEGQIYGAGGGHSAGYGIKPSSNAVVGADAAMTGGYPANVADDYKRPSAPGLVGGTATPSADLITMGAATSSALGGRPGGTIKLTLSGVLSIAKDSSVDANGLEPQISAAVACKDSGRHAVGCPGGNRVPEVALVGGGGGGGGAVWIDALSIIGEGTISANGGSVNSIVGTVNGMAKNVASPGGAGGGGRVAVYYNEQLAPNVTVRALGGRSQEFTAYGTAGLVFIKSTKTFAEELVVDNGYDRQQNSWPATTLPSGALAALTLKGAAIVRAEAALSVALLTMSNRAQLRALTNSGDLRIRSELVSISDGARVFAGLIDIAALKIDIGGAATEIAAAGTSSGGVADGATSPNMGGGGGGSPRSAGGSCASVAGGMVSTDNRGGRGGTVVVGSSSVPGGLGGGVVRLNAYVALAFTGGPTVTVAGDPATSQGNIGAGGGGAGTIDIIADAVTGTAKFNADGGNTAGSGGAGSGGLVRLQSMMLTALPSSVAVSVSGGTNSGVVDCVGNAGAIVVDPLPANRTRFLCRGGTFDDGAMTLCQQCAAGTSAEQPGSTSCTPCAAGSFAKTAGSVACTQCFPGTFVGGMMATECTQCDAGNEAPNRGSTMCVACAPGSSAASKGTPKCAPCAAGQEADDDGRDDVRRLRRRHVDAGRDGQDDVHGVRRGHRGAGARLADVRVLQARLRVGHGGRGVQAVLAGRGGALRGLAQVRQVSAGDVRGVVGVVAVHAVPARPGVEHRRPGVVHRLHDRHVRRPGALALVHAVRRRLVREHARLADVRVVSRGHVHRVQHVWHRGDVRAARLPLAVGRDDVRHGQVHHVFRRQAARVRALERVLGETLAAGESGARLPVRVGGRQRCDLDDGVHWPRRADLDRRTRHRHRVVGAPRSPTPPPTRRRPSRLCQCRRPTTTTARTSLSSRFRPRAIRSCASRPRASTSTTRPIACRSSRPASRTGALRWRLSAARRCSP